MKQIIAFALLAMLSLQPALAQDGANGQERDVKNILSYIQHAMQFNKAAPQEKVYLHFDNTGYFKGEIIRFKAYLTRMDTDQKSNISKVLYVELVNPSGDVIEKRTLKVENGEAEGDIKLDSIVGPSGFFEVRAFTRYMTNFGTSAAFSRVFPIFNKPKTEGNYANPQLDQISFRHRLPNNRVDATTGEAVSNGLSTEESGEASVVRNVRFYPEGGDMVVGLKGRVAILVTDQQGKHMAVKGELLDGQKQKIQDVETDLFGRGDFFLKPTTGKYYMRFVGAKGKNVDFELPAAKADGCALTVDTSDEERISFNIQSTTSMQGKLLGYTIMHNGEVIECDTMTARPTIKKWTSRYSLGEGVNQLTVFDSNGQIMAERLFFLIPYASADDSIYVTTEMTNLTPCGKVTLNLETEPNASISFSALDAATVTGGKEGNAKTWMLLSSEVAGYIDNPDYYFEADDEEHRRAADLLMMVQGWRRYDWKLMSGQKALEKVQPVEDGLYLFGWLKARSKKRPIDNVSLDTYLFNRQGDHLKGSAVTDSLGRFTFKVDDISGDWNMQIITKVEGEAENYIVGIDRHFSPDKRMLSPYETRTLPVPETRFFNEANAAPEEEEHISITKKVHVLPTVKIKTRRILGDLSVTWLDETNAQRAATVFYDCDKASDEIGDSGEVMPTFEEWLKTKNPLIDGNTDPSWQDAVWVRPFDPTDEETGIVNRFTDELQMETIYQVAEEKPMIAYTTGLRYDKRPIVWIVDNTFHSITGFNRTRFNFNRTNNHTGAVLKPISLTEAKAVYFTEDVNVLIPFIESSQIHELQPVIAMVYTHPFYYFNRKGLRRTHFDGYNLPTKFEMEDYSIMPPMEDFRRTIFWDANVKTDAKGRAKIEFYNNSSATQLLISAEGVTSTGHFLISE